MIQPQLPDDRRPPLTPQLALRVTLLGGFALTMFAIILFRLWFLQVLSGNEYVAQAKQNRTRKVLVAAPRGEIVDRNGAVLVRSRQATAVQIVPTQLPVPIKDPTISELRSPRAADRALYARLAGVLGISTARQGCKVVGYKKVNGMSVAVPHHLRLPLIACDVAQAVYGLPYADATVATDVKQEVLFYLRERHAAFPGVTEPQVYLTSYPHTTLAAQVLGTVGPVTLGELKQSAFKGLPQSAVVGQTGLEYYYDRYLRGVDGAEQVEVDSVGNPIKVLPEKAAIAGNTLKTSLDLGLQQAGQASLAQSISANTPGGAGGAFVAMDPQNGQIYAMGSLPSYNPNIFTKPISQSVYNSLISATSGDPLNNRAVDGLYPTGSTFKPITATAALESGTWSLSDTYDDTGKYCFTLGGLCLYNAGHVANGVLDLVNAIRVSDDVFFYNLGAKLNVDVPRGGPLQQWARLFGIGQATGIDLPYEASGNLPDPQWRASLNKREYQCDTATGPFTGKPKHPPGGCGIADGTNRPWSVGDNVNLAVGQGDVLVTPLQLAVVYSAIANGGTIVRPHIGLQVENNIGDKVLQNIDPPPSRHINIDPAYLDAIRTGLREAASAPGGTSADVMGNFPEPVYGKTGTAQTFPHGIESDQAWYACYVPATATSKPITVVVTVEKGGFGDIGAAPVARQILSQWFLGKPGTYKAGTSATL